MANRESPWTRDICNELVEQGAWFFAIVGGKFQKSGLPDRVIAHRTTGVMFLEFKGEKTKVKPIQRYVMNEMRRRVESSCVVVRCPDRVENPDGTLLCRFDGSGHGLLLALAALRAEETSL